MKDQGASGPLGIGSKEQLDRLAAATLRHTPKQRYTAGDRIEEKARAHPQRPFLRFDGRRLSYGEFNRNVSTQELAEALAGFPGLEIANVYGVKVPNMEGRAGMAALLLRDRGAFDARAFYEFTEDRPPRYAIPSSFVTRPSGCTSY